MTLQTCLQNCTGFTYWGTEYGSQCYCGDTLASSSTSAPFSECNMVCSGDPYEYCGGSDRLELYSTIATPTATLGVVPTVGPYSFVGCWTEGTDVRALSDDSYADDSMTLESCASFCSGYVYFGTEYGDECECCPFCGCPLKPAANAC